MCNEFANDGSSAQDAATRAVVDGVRCRGRIRGVTTMARPEGLDLELPRPTRSFAFDTETRAALLERFGLVGDAFLLSAVAVFANAHRWLGDETSASPMGQRHLTVWDWRAFAADPRAFNAPHERKVAMALAYLRRVVELNERHKDEYRASIARLLALKLREYP